ncbi:uncharacterized protein LOC120347719 [Styela clava]|uniref:uncharacterized protein LOC120347719 n=1 Tax=Styela clava TaxID=7725 RepID=UPI00193A67AE|nr:uncharacterized protein LOC120347719 [Styela clava]
MLSFVTKGVLILLVIGISQTKGECCGRGRNGFCKNCARVGFWRSQKCCGLTSGNEKGGCNIFCCNCICAHGHPIISWRRYLKAGESSHYTCKQDVHTVPHGDAERYIDLDSKKNAWDVFNSLDQDQDLKINRNEFFDAMKARLSDDHDDADLFASHLLDTDFLDTIAAYLDADDDMIHDTVKDRAMASIFQEFNKMDVDEDGYIQAGEFDKDLK